MLHEVLGCSEEQAMVEWLQRFDRLVEPALRGELAEQIAVAAEAGIGYSMEYAFQGAEGQHRWLVETAIPVLDGSRLVQEWIGILTDVTPSKTLALANDQYRRELEVLVEERTSSLQVALKEAERARESIQELLDFDWLTGVETRSRFYRRCGDGRRHAPMCIAMIDLDFFKSVNDLYGHEVGISFREFCALILSEMPDGHRWPFRARNLR